MTWVRQYLVIHTGNRIDAVLGTHVFSHMLRLPVRYFEQRPTGVVVSRLHGVETIRDFLSGAAVSLVLDLPFLVIFLVVMFWYSWQLTIVALVGLAADLGHEPGGDPGVPQAPERAVPAGRAQPGLRHRVRRRHGHGEEHADGADAGAPLRRLSGELPQGRVQRAPALQHRQRHGQHRRAGDDPVHPGGRRAAGHAQRRLHHRHAGGVPDVRQPHVPADAAPGRAVAGVPAGLGGGQAPGRHDEHPHRALRRGAGAQPAQRRAHRHARGELPLQRPASLRLPRLQHDPARRPAHGADGRRRVRARARCPSCCWASTRRPKARS